MRIVSGRYRGRRLRGPSHPGLRPTAERVREAIFDILGPRVRGAVVLDLFAGAGGLGLEAMSRGANHVVFVERDRRALTLLRRNLAELGLGEGEVEVVPGEVLAVLRKLAAGGRRFTLILADPPYDAGLSEPTLTLVAEGALLDREGLLVLEHRSSEVPAPPTGLVLVERRTYGDTAVSFFKAGAGL